MLIRSGKHEGKTSEIIALKHGSYVQWYLDNYPNSHLGREFTRLIQLFDAKPFTKKCVFCSKIASRASIYRENYDFMFFCEGCDPYNTGARANTLNFVKMYRQALTNIDNYAGGRRSFKDSTIRELAKGKGLPNRVGQKEAEAFFGD